MRYAAVIGGKLSMTQDAEIHSKVGQRSLLCLLPFRRFASRHPTSTNMSSNALKAAGGLALLMAIGHQVSAARHDARASLDTIPLADTATRSLTAHGIH